MWDECDCCRTMQPDVYPLGELGNWCDTCACEPGGCLNAAQGINLAMSGTSTPQPCTWAVSDKLHIQLGSTVRNHDKAWTAPIPAVTWLTQEQTEAINPATLMHDQLRDLYHQLVGT